MTIKLSDIRTEIIPNMYEMGFFKCLLISRKRLRIATATAVILLIALFAIIGYSLRHVSHSFALNALLIVFLYADVVVTGYLLALTLGDIFFAGPWRDKMRLGGRYIPDKIEDQEALIKNKNIYFVLLFAASLVFLALGGDLVTGQNLRWYHSVGSGLILLQNDDPASRAYHLESLSNSIHSHKYRDPDVQKQIIRMIDDPDDTVRGWAAYIAGEGKMIDGIEPLVELLEDESASMGTRAEAAIALGRIDWKPARAALMNALRSTFRHDRHEKELVPSILYTFYQMKDSSVSHEVIQMLKSCLTSQDCSDQTYQYAFFYIKSLKVADGADVALQYIRADLPLSYRCYAADSLRFASRSSDIADIKRAFDTTPRDTECDVVYRKYHSEAAVILFEADTMRALHLRAVGNYMDPNQYDWIWNIGSNTNENPKTRKVAEIYARAMKDKGIVP